MLDQVVVAVLFLLVYQWKIEWFPVFSSTWIHAKKLMRDAWPLIFAGMVVSVYMKIDQVMLKEMLDAKAVGVFAAAVKLCEAWYFVPGVVAASATRTIIKVVRALLNSLEESIVRVRIFCRGVRNVRLTLGKTNT